MLLDINLPVELSHVICSYYYVKEDLNENKTEFNKIQEYLKWKAFEIKKDKSNFERQMGGIGFVILSGFSLSFLKWSPKPE